MGKKAKMRNKVLLCLGVFIVVFITTMTVIYCVKGSVPDTLIQYTLGAGGLEALLLAGITVAKVFAGEKEKKTNDTEY